jgi:hypothetical protein
MLDDDDPSSDTMKGVLWGEVTRQINNCPASYTTLTMMKFTSCILVVLCGTVPNVNARRRVVSTTALSSTSNTLRRRGDALKNPSFDVRKHTLISEEVVKDVRGGQGGGTATMSSEMFNMVKAVVGVGVLSLPAGKLSMFLCGPSYY